MLTVHFYALQRVAVHRWVTDLGIRGNIRAVDAARDIAHVAFQDRLFLRIKGHPCKIAPDIAAQLNNGWTFIDIDDTAARKREEVEPR